MSTSTSTSTTSSMIHPQISTDLASLHPSIRSHTTECFSKRCWTSRSCRLRLQSHTRRASSSSNEFLPPQKFLLILRHHLCNLRICQAREKRMEGCLIFKDEGSIGVIVEIIRVPYEDRGSVTRIGCICWVGSGELAVDVEAGVGFGKYGAQ